MGRPRFELKYTNPPVYVLAPMTFPEQHRVQPLSREASDMAAPFQCTEVRHVYTPLLLFPSRSYGASS